MRKIHSENTFGYSIQMTRISISHLTGKRTMIEQHITTFTTFAYTTHSKSLNRADYFVQSYVN